MWAGLCSAGFVDRGSSFGIFNKDLKLREFASWPGLKAPVKQRVLFFFFFLLKYRTIADGTKALPGLFFP